MTTYKFDGYDRQTAAFMCFAKLGPKWCWTHILADFSRGRLSGLGGGGPALMPTFYAGGKAYYDDVSIREFVRAARLHDRELRAIKSIVPATYEISIESMHPAIPAKMRKARLLTHPTASVSA